LRFLDLLVSVGVVKEVELCGMLYDQGIGGFLEHGARACDGQCTTYFV
jgi:hypothetical protein